MIRRFTSARLDRGRLELLSASFVINTFNMTQINGIKCRAFLFLIFFIPCQHSNSRIKCSRLSKNLRLQEFGLLRAIL